MTAAELAENKIKWDWIFNPKEVPTLCFISTTKIVQLLWRNKIVEKRRLGDLISLFNDDQPTCIELIYRTVHISWTEREKSTHIKLSRLLSDIHLMMQNYACCLKDDCEDWLKYMPCVIFPRYSEDKQVEILARFDDFVYDVNGWIDDVETAKKMLTCGKFNALEEYAIACWFCFEDEIQRLWPVVSVSKETDVCSITLLDHGLMFYWTCQMMNRTSELPSDWQMFKYYTYEPVAKQYFLDKVIDVEQKQRFIGNNMFNFGFEGSTAYARYLFPKLDDEFLEGLIRPYFGPEILARMIVSENDHVLVLPFFLKVKKWFNGEEFAKIFDALIQIILDYFIDEVDHLDQIDTLVEVIWDNAPTLFKEFASDYFRRNPVLWDEFGWLVM